MACPPAAGSNSFFFISVLKQNLRDLSQESMLESVRPEVAKQVRIQSARLNKKYPDVGFHDMAA